MSVTPSFGNARMESGVEYRLIPRNEVTGYQWKIEGRVTIAKRR